MKKLGLLTIIIFIFCGCATSKSVETLKQQNLELLKEVYEDRVFLVERVRDTNLALQEIKKALDYLFFQDDSYKKRLFAIEVSLESLQQQMDELEKKINKLHNIDPDDEDRVITK